MTHFNAVIKITLVCCRVGSFGILLMRDIFANTAAVITVLHDFTDARHFTAVSKVKLLVLHSWNF